MNQKKALLLMNRIIVPTHTIEVGTSPNFSTKGAVYGCYVNNWGRVTPSLLKNHLIYYFCSETATEDFVLQLNYLALPFDYIQVTRLDTLKNIILMPREQNYAAKGEFFTSEDVGKTIDLIIEPA